VSVAGTTGLLVRDVGQVTGQVRVGPQPGQPTSKVRLANMVFVGLPGSPASEVPVLAPPAPLTVPDMTEDSGQGSVFTHYRGSTAVRARLVIARCYGPGPLRIFLNTFSDQGRPTGTITCDDVQHELQLPTSVLVHILNISTSRLTSYRVGLSRR
jgi:hypothetical protein